jgi:DNA-binding NarL/FixJ family response regulator
MNKPRVLIADDHPILGEGLRSLLEPEFDVVGLVADGHALVTAAQKHQPDVIVTDVTMPSLTGIEAAAQLREQGVTAKIVFLTMHRDVGYARRAMGAGASGYVLKHSASSELLSAVREAVQGRTYITPLIAGELLQSYREAAPHNDDSDRKLTARQREVLRFIAEGRSAKEVAAALKISVRTAEAHRANILEALELNSTAELVQYAIRHGIISV